MRSAAAALLALAVAFAGCAEPSDGTDDPGTGAGSDGTGGTTPPDDEGTAPPAANATRNVEEMLGGDLEVRTEDVPYAEGRTGRLAVPVAGGPYPGVVVVHEWWGLNDQIREAARLLASHGYAVLAVDLFGSVATTQEEARAQTRAYDATRGVGEMRDAAVYLRERANATSVSSLGWCFGGGQSLQLALSGEPLAATVLYYGQPVNDTARLERVAWPVLGVFGGEDGSIPVAAVRDFDRALNESGVEHEIHVYPGVGHAFANPSGANWAPEATEDAWARTLAFLEKNAR